MFSKFTAALNKGATSFGLKPARPQPTSVTKNIRSGLVFAKSMNRSTYGFIFPVSSGLIRSKYEYFFLSQTFYVVWCYSIYHYFFKLMFCLDLDFLFLNRNFGLLSFTIYLVPSITLFLSHTITNSPSLFNFIGRVIL